MADEGVRGTHGEEEQDDGVSLIELAIPRVEHWKLLVFGPLLAGMAALGITYLIAPTFTARTTFLPPQQQQSIAASALALLGELVALVGGVGHQEPGRRVRQGVTVQGRPFDTDSHMVSTMVSTRWKSLKAKRLIAPPKLHADAI